MNFKKPYNDPQNYYWFGNGFNESELDFISKNIVDIPFQDGVVFGDDDSETVKSVRRSTVKWIPKDHKWIWLYSKLMDYVVIANDALWNFDLISSPEQIQYAEYSEKDSGHYDWHQDIGPNEGSHRKVSITVQLSSPSEYEGGDLELWQGGQSIHKAHKGAGTVFIFPSYMMHRVTNVTSGVRRSFVLWVGGAHYR